MFYTFRLETYFSATACRMGYVMLWSPPATGQGRGHCILQEALSTPCICFPVIFFPLYLCCTCLCARTKSWQDKMESGQN